MFLISAIFIKQLKYILDKFVTKKKRKKENMQNNENSSLQDHRQFALITMLK